MADETAGATTTAPEPTAPAAPEWLATLPDDLRADKSLATFKDIGALAKSYVETKKMVGQRLAPPKDDAPQEEWDKFYSALGRPETPDKYEFAKPEGMPDDLVPDETMLAKFKTMAHAIGLTPKQVKALSQFDGERALRMRDIMLEHTAKERKTAEEALHKEWGPKDGPMYKRNLALARNAVKALYSDDVEMATWAEDAGNDPKFVRLMHRIGEKLLEDGDLTADAPSALSASEADAKILELKKQPAYQNQAHPDHERILDEITALFRQKLGRENKVLDTIG